MQRPFDFKVHERLSPEAFINRIRRADGWILIHSAELPHALELYVREGSVIEAFVTPEFAEMRELAVKLFFMRLNDALETCAGTRNKI